jgi:hypothetical protein
MTITYSAFGPVETCCYLDVLLQTAEPDNLHVGQMWWLLADMHGQAASAVK